MMKPFRPPLVPGALCLAFGVSLAGCDQLLVEPASEPTTAIALALSPSGPNFAVAPQSANRARIQVRDDGTVLLDTTFSFSPDQEELVVPVRFSGAARSVELLVEIADDSRPLLRGSTGVALLQRRVTEAEVNLQPASVAPLAPAFALTAGIYHSCAAGSEAGVFCWGENEAGQLGTGKFTPSPLAVNIEGSGGMYGISAGYLTTCGLASEGAAFCWGDNEHGSLGSSSSPARSAVPVPVATTASFSTITVNGLHACGLTTGGEALCWGFNGFGQLGDGSTTDRAEPVRVATELRFQSISAGYIHTCGITTRGQTYCWGQNEFGQLGDGSETDRLEPVRIGGEQSFVEVSAGGLHTCGRSAAGEAFCWGYNGFGQLGTGSAQNANLPQSVGASRFVALSAGGLHSCGVATDRRALCWGYNRSGALGDDTVEDRLAPVVVTGGLTFGLVRAGLHHTCGTVAGGSVVCWGYNRFGQLGDGSRSDRSEPGDVLFGETFFSEAQDDSSEMNEAVVALLSGRLLR